MYYTTISTTGKSKRNIMKSIQLNNDRLIQSQLHWRYDKNHEWVNAGTTSRHPPNN